MTDLRLVLSPLRHAMCLWIFVGSVAAGVNVSAANLNWIRQISTPSPDESRSAAVDGDGNVYISGSTEGALAQPVMGGGDPFLSKFDRNGNLLWARQQSLYTDEGYTAISHGYGVSTDSQGSVFISGYAWLAFMPGATNQTDAFVIKYDRSGNLIWSRRFGLGVVDESFAVSADGHGNVFIAGDTSGKDMPSSERDASVSLLNSAGDLMWTRQIETTHYDAAAGVAADGVGNAYVAGATYGDLQGPMYNWNLPNPFLSKLDFDGNIVWTRQIRSFAVGRANGVTVDGLGNIFVVGAGGASESQTDAFVSKFDADGNQLWMKTLSTPLADESFSIATDGNGNVFVSGSTGGILGKSAGGYYDAFLSKFDGTGNWLWTEQLGSAQEDRGYGVATDGNGRVYLTGSSIGGLGGVATGRFDAFLAQYSDIPEPAAVQLLMLSLGILGPRARARVLRGIKADSEIKRNR